MEQIFIDNAGLVLLNPYLPRLFSSMTLVEDNGFVDRSAVERGALLLQFAVSMRTDASESQFVLNKILCGIRLDEPMTRGIDVTASEQGLIESMLKAVIEHWTALGVTSVASLQSNFLQRTGVLKLKDDGWHLRVENKPYDILLDRLPWSYQLINLPWMTKELHVDWR